MKKKKRKSECGVDIHSSDHRAVVLSARRAPCPSLPSDWEGEGRGVTQVLPHGSAPSFFPPLPRFRLILLTASLPLCGFLLLHPPVDCRCRRTDAYLQDGPVRLPSKVPVSPSEAAQVQGVDGHVGGGLPCRAGAIAGPGVLVDDHLRRESGGECFMPPPQ